MKKNNIKYIIIMPNKSNEQHFIPQYLEMMIPNYLNLHKQKNLSF
jgi:hypothetical protein